MPNYQALKIKLQDAQFAAMVAVGNCNDLADAFNSLTSANAGPVTIAECSDGWFSSGIANASLRISALPDATKQAKWRDVLQYLHLVKPPIKLTIAPASSMLQAAESDGVLTAGEVAAITTRTGSLAEVIGFFDTITETPQQLTHTDIAKALRS